MSSEEPDDEDIRIMLKIRRPEIKGKARTLYDTLHLHRNATLKDITSSYRAMCLVAHPDKNITKKADMRKLANAIYIMIDFAYKTLSNPLERKYYDDFLDSDDFFPHGDIYTDTAKVTDAILKQRRGFWALQKFNKQYIFLFFTIYKRLSLAPWTPLWFISGMSRQY